MDNHDGDLFAALRSIRATIKVKDGEILEVKLPSSKTTDQTLAHLAKLTTLKKLDLSMCSDVTDEGARHLAKLNGLEEHDLFAPLVGNTGQAYLRNLTNLRHLSLSGNGTEEGLRHLRNLTNLESLRVGYGTGYPVTADGLNHLLKLTKLKQLRLDGCEISDDSLEVISGFRQLENLKIEDGMVEVISLDHDLGDDDRGTGNDVVKWIEEQVVTAGFAPPEMRGHSASVSARTKM